MSRILRNAATISSAHLPSSWSAKFKLKRKFNAKFKSFMPELSLILAKETFKSQNCFPPWMPKTKAKLIKRKSKGF